MGGEEAFGAPEAVGFVHFDSAESAAEFGGDYSRRAAAEKGIKHFVARLGRGED